MLCEVNSGVGAESGAKKTEEGQYIFSFYVFCAANNTQAKEKSKEGGCMSRGEGEPKVHSNAIHEWEGLVRHMFGKPGEWAWSVDDMLDGLHNEGCK